MQIISLKNTAIDQIIAKASQVLAQGGLVIYPTETVYGAGVDATNQQAVDKLLSYKSRREGKPLSVAVTNLAMASKLVEVNSQAKHIYQKFLPGPITVVSAVKNNSQLAKGVASEFNTLGIRMPAYPLIEQLVAHYQKPITATSANASGKKRPYTIDDVLNSLSNKQKSLIDLIIDAGRLPPNQPSTVIDTTLSTPITLRQGDWVHGLAGELAEDSRVSEKMNESIDMNLAKTKQMNNKQTDAKVASAFKHLKLIGNYQLLSQNEGETQDIAGKLVLKYWDNLKKTGLLIGLNGQLGVGKTIFAKGVAKFLQINSLLRSPTYNYWFDYDYVRHQTAGKLVHADVWKVDSKETLIEIDLLAQLLANNILVIEWFSQIAPFIRQTIKTPLIVVDLQNVANDDENEFASEPFLANNHRQLLISEFMPVKSNG